MSSVGMPSVMQTINSNLGVGRFHDRVGRIRRRHKDHGSIRRRSFHSFLHRVEDRPAFVRRASLARSHSADDLRSIFRTRLGVKRAFPPGQPLHNHPRRFIYQNAHEFVSAFNTVVILSGAKSFARE